VLICTPGDLLLDVIVRLEQQLEAAADASAVTRVGAGGQAANVAAWAAELGARARFVGKRANDAAERLAAGLLEGYGVTVLGPVAAGRTGVVVSLVAPDGERTMASDRGVAPDLRAEEVDEAWFDGCSHLHVSGYGLLRSPIDEAAARAVRTARTLKATVSVDLASWAAIRNFGSRRLRRRLEALAPDVLFANERERDALGGELAAGTAVLKRGAARYVIERGETRLELAALPGDVVDSTGAGDAVAAGFLLGGSPAEAGLRGLEAARRCVAKLGGMP
jgi:sugar/nucleoside kinase (ribokinase family)